MTTPVQWAVAVKNNNAIAVGWHPNPTHCPIVPVSRRPSYQVSQCPHFPVSWCPNIMGVMEVLLAAGGSKEATGFLENYDLKMPIAN